MRIRFTRLPADRHALEILRDDGSLRERVELETRSFLLHDLTHYALESAAGIERGVWGALQAGRSLAEISDGDSEMMTVEVVTGPLSAAAQGRISVEAAHAGIVALLAAQARPRPHWLTNEILASAVERMRQLIGRWRATPFHQAMELSWPAQ